MKGTSQANLSDHLAEIWYRSKNSKDSSINFRNISVISKLRNSVSTEWTFPRHGFSEIFLPKTR